MLSPFCPQADRNGQQHGQERTTIIFKMMTQRSYKGILKR